MDFYFSICYLWYEFIISERLVLYKCPTFLFQTGRGCDSSNSLFLMFNVWPPGHIRKANSLKSSKWCVKAISYLEALSSQIYQNAYFRSELVLNLVLWRRQEITSVKGEKWASFNVVLLTSHALKQWYPLPDYTTLQIDTRKPYTLWFFNNFQNQLPIERRETPGWQESL